MQSVATGWAPSLALLLLLVPSAWAVPRSLLAVAPRSPWTLRELEAVHAELVSYDPDTGVAYVTATSEETRRLLDLGFALSTVQPDLTTGLRTLQRRPDLGLYHTYDETVAELESLQARHPSIAHVEVIGKSVERRDILALKISDEVLQDDPVEPDVLVVGCHHAREFMSVEVPLHLARTLLEGYGQSPRLTRLVDTRELWIVPMLNPDGHVFQEEFAASPNWAPPGWRKNRRLNFDESIGVDPNRNYEFNWGYDDTGSSPDGNDETFRGTNPFSEPETQAVRALAERHRFTIAISYHSFGRLLLYPWGYTRSTLSPDQPVFATLADSMVRMNGYRPGNPYFGTIYLTNGDFDDYMYGALTPRKEQSTISFTPELNSAQEGGFWPEDSLIVPTCAALLEANLFALAVADSVRAPMPPPQPVLSGAQDAVDGRRIHLGWTQQQDLQNPVTHYEVFELDPNDAPSVAPSVRLSNSGRALMVRDLSRPASGVLALRVQAELEPLWDYMYVEARVPGDAWRTLAGDATRDASPTGQNSGRGITGPQLDRLLRFDLGDLRGARFDVAVRLAAHPQSPRRPQVHARLDVLQTYSERRRILDPDVRGNSYDVVADRPGLLGYGITAVDVQGQKSDSEILFFSIPVVDVQLSDVRLESEGRRLVLRWRASSVGPARVEAWTRESAVGEPLADAAREWASGGYALAGEAGAKAGEGSLSWSASPASWIVLLRAIDSDGPRLWGPWRVEVLGATVLRLSVPNPFNPGTAVAFEVERGGPVRLEVLSVDGRSVRPLVSQWRPAGEHVVHWDGRDTAGRPVASGIYIVRLAAGAQVRTRRLVLLR